MWGLASRREALEVVSLAKLEQLPALQLFDPGHGDGDGADIHFLPVRSLSLSVPINPPDIPVMWADALLSDIGQ